MLQLLCDVGPAARAVAEAAAQARSVPRLRAPRDGCTALCLGTSDKGSPVGRFEGHEAVTVEDLAEDCGLRVSQVDGEGLPLYQRAPSVVGLGLDRVMAL